ncbi:MAG: hypothetical protein HKN12_10355 [Gemmatimonadetes bacterium]|nr:hypothetical protein [Gemmatimonadota bacterium]
MDVTTVLIIMGLVAAIAIPGFRSMMDGYRHRGSVDAVTGKLFMTRQLAIRNKSPYVVALDAVNRQITGFLDQNGNGVQDAGDTAINPVQMYDGVQLNNVDWPAARLMFFPNGRASATSDLTVTDNDGRIKTIRVSSITGTSQVLP